MPDVIQLLRAVLLAAPAVAAIVGARVRPWPANQPLELPCVLLAMISMVRTPAMLGSHLDRARVQVDCLGRSASERAQLADAVRAALMDYSGSGIDRVFFLSASERVDDRAGNYGMMMEFDVITA